MNYSRVSEKFAELKMLLDEKTIKKMSNMNAYKRKGKLYVRKYTALIFVSLNGSKFEFFPSSNAFSSFKSYLHYLLS